VLWSRIRVGVLLAPLVGMVALMVPSVATAAPTTRSPGSAIEAFASYQGQTICDPVARPGVVAFRDLVLAAYPGTGDSGIVRACTVGGSSEHKEGRAWDWRVNTSDAVQVEQVDDLMTWLLETDEHGNAAAMARRFGVMYVIWDSRIWKSYQAERGWQPYFGVNPHTDHLHVSFSWAGAYMQTSYWTGRVAPTMYAPTPVCATSSPSPTVSPSPTASASPRVSATPSTSPSASPTPCASPSPSPAVYDRQAYLTRQSSRDNTMPGPWRRH